MASGDRGRVQGRQSRYASERHRDHVRVHSQPAPARHPAGKNFIVTHEPTFYNHFDDTKGLEDDPVYRYKQEFIRKNNLVLWRFHDHWHARKPDGIFVGFARTLGWEAFAMKGAPGASHSSFVMPPRPFAEVAREIRSRLNTRSMRLIGDPNTPISKVCTMGHELSGAVRLVRDFDLLLAPEVREWDSVEYLRDLAVAGGNKAAAILAHERVEEFGMEECATWLRTFVPEVPVEYIPSGEPFWGIPNNKGQARPSNRSRPGANGKSSNEDRRVIR